MKKLFIMAMAIAAIGFTSCGNKAQNAEGTESAESTEVSATVEAAKQVTEQIKEKIAAGDSKAIGEAIQAATDKVAELIAKGDKEAAQQYQEQIKTFIEEHAEQIKAAVGNDEAVTKLVDSFAALPTDVKEALNAAGDSIKAEGQKIVDEGKQKLENAVNQEVEKGKEKLENAVNQEVEKGKQKAADAIKGLLKQ